MNPIVLLIGGSLFLLALSGSGGGGTLAEQLAADIRKRKYDYSRALAKKFQTSAGLPADGIYGPDTAKALARYTTAPPALFKGASAPKKPAAPKLSAAR